MKKFSILLSVFLFISCEYLEKLSEKKVEKNEPIIASVYDVNLYVSDIQGVTPKGVSLQDSLVFMKGYINNWAKQQLLLKKAEENISEVNNKEINDLVNNYRESLYINGYKDKLIKQQLDTLVTEDEIENYYNNHKDNFKLTEELLQLKYVYYGKGFLNEKEIIKKFKSDKEEDLGELENQTINFKDYHLRDSTWLTYNTVLEKIPPFKEEQKEKLLKISKFIQKQDSLGVYLVAVNKVLNKNDVAPLSYIIPQIKQLILHKRKLELIREIEKTLINDAIKNGNFKEH